MSKAPKISPVKNNKQKQQNYQKLISYYNAAIQKGFYAEAELIVYAFLEDRLRSLIYYLGAIKVWNRQWLTDEAAAVAGQVTSLNDMSTKIDVMRKVLKAAGKHPFRSGFLTAIGQKFTEEQMDALLDVLKGIDKWRDYRNEVVHSLFNKDLDELEANFRKHVEDGFAFGRDLDNTIKRIRKMDCE